MGTWGTGLLDSDGPLDVIDEYIADVEEELFAALDGLPTASDAPRIATLVGLILQFSPYTLEDEEEAFELAAGLRRHGEIFVDLPEGARAILTTIASGKGQRLTSCDIEPSPELLRALGAPCKDFVRRPSLFALPDTSAVQELAERCSNELERALKPKIFSLNSLSHMAALAMLLLLNPCYVSPKLVTKWQGIFMESLPKLIAKVPDCEKDFYVEYGQNADLAFDLCLHKFKRLVC